ncbi:MAG: hypothetical protein LBL55_02150 [Propionibacteriaceae bacterium]|nr:hypothetical protein [Propionibacteriaceae bacterium]
MASRQTPASISSSSRSRQGRSRAATSSWVDSVIEPKLIKAGGWLANRGV